MDQNDTTSEASMQHTQKEENSAAGTMSYLRFGAMILTSMVFMYIVMYLNSFELDHVRWSETRFFMTLLMGATMAVVMLGFMFGMYKNMKLNLAIVAGSLLLLAVGAWLVRSQTTVQDTSYMSGMIPHHSIAILTSERSDLSDVRVCELAVGITEAQRREIAEMSWLIDDIDQNGPAATRPDADARPVPDFEGSSIRTCP